MSRDDELFSLLNKRRSLEKSLRNLKKDISSLTIKKEKLESEIKTLTQTLSFYAECKASKRSLLVIKISPDEFKRLSQAERIGG